MGNKVRISKKAVRRESCRVAAAFGVRFFKPLSFNPDKRKIDTHFHGYTRQQVGITWVLDLHNARWMTMYIFECEGEDERYCSVYLSEKGSALYSHTDSRYNEIMARGLYCLGFEDEDILTELPPLSEHEKLELRLSMPREFCPSSDSQGKPSKYQARDAHSATMTEQEAEVYVERLRRIWVPDELNACEMMDYRPQHLRFHVHLREHIALMCQVAPSSEAVFVLLRKAGEMTTGQLSYSSSVGIGSGDAIVRAKLYAQFATEWMPFFRRNCWLSGCNIEASAHEKFEWIQGFTRKELEAWNLKM